MICRCATLLSVHIWKLAPKQSDSPFSSVCFSKSWDLYLKSTVYLKDNFHNYEMSTMANVVQCIECKYCLAQLSSLWIIRRHLDSKETSRELQMLSSINIRWLSGHYNCQELRFYCQFKKIESVCLSWSKSPWLLEAISVFLEVISWPIELFFGSHW